MPASTNELRIALIGKTGSGKSRTGNSILGAKVFLSKMTSASVTKLCRYEKHLNYGREIAVVDTPGLFDTDVSNEDTAAEIVKFIGLTSPGPHAIVLVTQICRFTEEERNTVRFFVNLFGVEIYKYLIVLFTHADALEEEDLSLEEYIESSHDALKKIVEDAGGRTIAFNNKEVIDLAKKEEQVQALFSLIDRTVVGNGGGCYTNEKYEEAEAALRKDEEEKRKKAEAAKKAEQESMIAAFHRMFSDKYAMLFGDRAALERYRAQLEKDHKDKMERIREVQRKEIEGGIFSWVPTFFGFIKNLFRQS